jgi:3-deoxy-D-manno-octulosonate 8-phosphate phosphatase KdsC-like HAD superfamily phosphatase
MNVTDSLDCIIFDTDGVLTDDRVWVDQDGREMVCCSRRDGLRFDFLRQSGLKLFILSTETTRSSRSGPPNSKCLRSKAALTKPGR